ncbi:MAG: HAD-IA family hydrolase [Bacillota bacterium]
MAGKHIAMDMKTSRTSPLDAVLFDLDGTLLDTTAAILASLRHTVELFTGKPLDMNQLRPVMGLPLSDIFAALTPHHVEEACAAYVEHNIAVHKDLVKPYPGVNLTIDALTKCGVKRALVTSKRRKTALLGLEIAGLSDAFDAMVCWGDTVKAKPDPEPVLLALKLLGLRESKGKVLFVGDSPWDVRAGKAAAPFVPGLKIWTAAVTYGATAADILRKENPDYILNSITELLPLSGCAPSPES